MHDYLTYALIAAGGFGAGIVAMLEGSRMHARYLMDRVGDERELREECAAMLDEAGITLTTLRGNCFIPDERGVERRYWDCSAERRAKAEGRTPA